MSNIAKITAFFSAIIMIIISLFGIADKNREFRVTTYIVADNVASSKNLHSEDFDIITDVIIFGCATFDKDGIVHTDELLLENTLTLVRDSIGERKVNLHINLLGPGPIESHDTWEDNMKDLSTQHNLAFASGVLVQNIVSFIDKYDFDGIYFDYEYPASKKDWKIFSSFLVDLDKMIGDRILGIAVSTDVTLSLDAMKAVDRVEAMLYDIYDKDGKHSTVKSTKTALSKITIKGIDKEKIDLGLPFYSRPTDKDAYWYGYSDYINQIDKNGYYFDETTGKTFWFNTPDVIAEKTEYAINIGLGGVMIWHYSCDLPSSNEASLLRSIEKSIKKANSNDYVGSLPC